MTDRERWEALNQRQADLYRAAGNINTPEVLAIVDQMRPLTPEGYGDKGASGNLAALKQVLLAQASKAGASVKRAFPPAPPKPKDVPRERLSDRAWFPRFWDALSPDLPRSKDVNLPLPQRARK